MKRRPPTSSTQTPVARRTAASPGVDAAWWRKWRASSPRSRAPSSPSPGPRSLPAIDADRTIRGRQRAGVELSGRALRRPLLLEPLGGLVQLADDLVLRVVDLHEAPAEEGAALGEGLRRPLLHGHQALLDRLAEGRGQVLAHDDRVVGD